MPPYTDKRTGIVYTDVTTATATRNEPGTGTHMVTPQKKPHLDAFIPNAFLKPYFVGGK